MGWAVDRVFHQGRPGGAIVAVPQRGDGCRGIAHDFMTAQIEDRVFHQKTTFGISRCRGTGRFEPRLHGIVIDIMHSACLRCHHVGYAIEDSQLFLKDLTFGAGDHPNEAVRTGKVPSLFGRQARLDGSAFSSWIIDELHHPVAFSGGMLLGAKFIDEFYCHHGFQALWKYREAREVLFDNGRLVEDFDLSSEMQAIQTRILVHQLEPLQQSAHLRMVEQWAQNCYSRDYTN